MALRVWLPLNGNLENKGLSDACRGEGTLAYGDGKIGKALYMEIASAANGIYAPKQEKQVYTVALWFKAPGYTGARRDLCNEGRDYNTYGWRVGLSANENTLTMTAAGSGGNYTQSFTPDTWYHIAFCRDENKTAYYYVNGVLVSTKTGTGDLNYSESNGFINIGRFCHNPTSNSKLYPYQGYINDFRYYDECLSPKQVKEISKGLIAHYKLTGVGANKNYIKNSNWSNKTNGGIYTFDGDVVTFHSDTLAASGISFTQTVDSAGITDFKNKKLTFSMEYQITEALTFGTTNPWVGFEIGLTRNTTTGGSNQSLDWYGGKSIPTAVTNGWVKKSFTVTVTNYDIANSSLGVSFFMRDTTGTIKYRHPKIEIGEVATDWIPNESDTLYTTLGYANNICTDVSGNGNNLTKTGTLTFDTNSPRNSGSTHFNNNTTYLTLPVLYTTGFANSFTIICWSKITSMSGKMMWGFNDGNRLNIYPTGSVICCNTGDGGNNPYQNNGTSIAFSQWNNGWHQFAMVGDGTSNKLYVDGELQATAKTYKGITGSHIYISGWGTGTNYKWIGNMSDFRIYSTALSADDIKELYQTSALIDNKNNVYAYEFVEGE